MDLMQLSPRQASRKVTVYKNGSLRPGAGIEMHINTGQSIQRFIESCGERLGVPAKALFTRDGSHIDDLVLLEDDDLVFVSGGEPFIEPVATGGGGGGARPTNIAGYRLTKYLGRGAYGKVYMGVHPLSKKQVALKLVAKSHMENLADAERVASEIHCLETLNHDNVIDLYGVEETDKDVVLVFEFAGGGDLCSRVRKEGKLDERTAWGFFRQLVDAVQYCHRHHIVHHDLKLENVLLSESGDVKVADFGLSTVYRPGSLSSSTAGSLAYLAPEVLASGAVAGPPRDVWSLGVLLYAMVVGHLPFEGTTDAQLSRRIKSGRVHYPAGQEPSGQCRDLIASMLDVDPDRRATLPRVRLHPWMRQFSAHTDEIVSPRSNASSPPGSESAASSSTSKGKAAPDGGGRPKPALSPVGEGVATRGGAGAGAGVGAEGEPSSAAGAAAAAGAASDAGAPEGSMLRRLRDLKTMAASGTVGTDDGDGDGDDRRAKDSGGNGSREGGDGSRSHVSRRSRLTVDTGDGSDASAADHRDGSPGAGDDKAPAEADEGSGGSGADPVGGGGGGGAGELAGSLGGAPRGDILRGGIMRPDSARSAGGARFASGTLLRSASARRLAAISASRHARGSGAGDRGRSPVHGLSARYSNASLDGSVSGDEAFASGPVPGPAGGGVHGPSPITATVVGAEVAGLSPPTAGTSPLTPLTPRRQQQRARAMRLNVAAEPLPHSPQPRPSPLGLGSGGLGGSGSGLRGRGRTSSGAGAASLPGSPRNSPMGRPSTTGGYTRRRLAGASAAAQAAAQAAVDDEAAAAAGAGAAPGGGSTRARRSGTGSVGASRRRVGSSRRSAGTALSSDAEAGEAEGEGEGNGSGDGSGGSGSGSGSADDGGDAGAAAGGRGEGAAAKAVSEAPAGEAADADGESASAFSESVHSASGHHHRHRHHHHRHRDGDRDRDRDWDRDRDGGRHHHRHRHHHRRAGRRGSGAAAVTAPGLEADAVQIMGGDAAAFAAFRVKPRTRWHIAIIMVRAIVRLRRARERTQANRAAVMVLADGTLAVGPLGASNGDVSAGSGGSDHDSGGGRFAGSAGASYVGSEFELTMSPSIGLRSRSRTSLGTADDAASASGTGAASAAAGAVRRPSDSSALSGDHSSVGRRVEGTNGEAGATPSGTPTPSSSHAHASPGSVSSGASQRTPGSNNSLRHRAGHSHHLGGAAAGAHGSPGHVRLGTPPLGRRRPGPGDGDAQQRWRRAGHVVRAVVRFGRGQVYEPHSSPMRGRGGGGGGSDGSPHSSGTGGSPSSYGSGRSGSPGAPAGNGVNGNGGVNVNGSGAAGHPSSRLREEVVFDDAEASFATDMAAAAEAETDARVQRAAANRAMVSHRAAATEHTPAAQASAHGAGGGAGGAPQELTPQSTATPSGISLVPAESPPHLSLAGSETDDASDPGAAAGAGGARAGRTPGQGVTQFIDNRKHRSESDAADGGAGGTSGDAGGDGAAAAAPAPSADASAAAQ